ncbi:MAG: thrombospondin type 3 repeat-containing protein, partial [Myxococcota bacterium]
VSGQGAVVVDIDDAVAIRVVVDLVGLGGERAENTDLDDYGDACDPCPYDAPLNSADDYGDADFDGVCNSVDNCLTTANPDQVNTNRLYENVYTSNAVWGDACEPVPQPRTEIDSGVSVLSASSSSNSFFDLTTYEIRQRKFTVTPQRSMPAPSSGPGFGQSAGALTTHFRFCQPGPNQTPPFCTAATSLDEAQLRLDLAGADQETPDMPYHRITLAGRQRGDTVVHSHTYSPSSDSGLAYEWLADDDAIFWKNNTIVDVPEPSGVLGSQLSEGDGLEGMLWVHASTPIGNTVNLSTGLHGPQLANALVPIDVYDTRSTTTAHPVQSIFDIYQIRQHWPDIWDPYQLVLGQQVYHLTDAEIPMSESARALIKDRAGVQWLAPELASMKMGNGPAWVGLSEGGGGIAAALFIDEDGVILSHHDLGIEFEDKSGESATLSIYS